MNTTKLTIGSKGVSPKEAGDILISDIELVNLTPHYIDIVDEEGHIIDRLEPTNSPLRLEEKKTKVATLRVRQIRQPIDSDGTDAYIDYVEVPLYRRVLHTTYLPEKVEGRAYIVSLPVALMNTHRNDLFVPNDYVRDNNGRIVGVLSLSYIGGWY